MANALRVDLDEEHKGYRWETEYERSWEAIRENEHGLLQPSVDDIVNKAKRKRIQDRRKMRLGMMRHLYIVIDMSESMHEHDYKPSRIRCCLTLVQNFLKDFFDMNPISQIGIIITRNKRREKISELSGNPKAHLEALKKLFDIECVGEPSLQNCLESALDTLKHMPSHTSKEVLVIFGSLTTCDPSDINQTIEVLAARNVRCSVIGLAAEVRICHSLAKQTKGTYNVALDESHLKDLLYDHLNPPPATANTESSLIRMGFPQYYNEDEGKPSMCVCHLSNNVNFSTSGYFCPQCNSKYCELPVECQVCGLTLVSSTHLSRSYHHLFPVDMFTVNEYANGVICFGCQIETKTAAQCEHCSNLFCIDCDLFIHESMHLCPGCASRRLQ
ncbi:General transcription factor IIH subunit 2-like protein [Dinothrombium tinctorium]|uniref:General transcription factor IIH subunit n=1 Tax=Dinothrombium tinctorium TaxID=1965070 RepID=A0A443R2B2_9ACAR|nr:General transcription factor IIH subunit 2-like protein [Dinothrombium tinctorium]